MTISYTCPICGKAYVRFPQYRRHVAKHKMPWLVYYDNRFKSVG